MRQLMRSLTAALRSERWKARGAALVLWIAYLGTVELLAHTVRRDRGQHPNPSIGSYFHGFIDKLAVAPPLARWDSIWFYGVAKEGVAVQSVRMAER
jgi:hypothetical protein